MLKLNVRTKHKPDEVVKRALAFFGPEGFGLKVTDQGDECASFEGGGGGITISACRDGEETSVDMETREWEGQVQAFALKLK